MNTSSAANQCPLGPEVEEGSLEKKGENSFHRKRLADDATRGSREAGPVRAELELHRDAGDHAEGKAQAKQLQPEPGGAIGFCVSAQGHGLEHQDEQRQPHGELRKEIVEGGGEAELQTVDISGFHDQLAVGSNATYSPRTWLTQKSGLLS
jgi:hypothetical protein